TQSRSSRSIDTSALSLEGIQEEREILAPLRSRAQNIIDTTHLAPKQLRQKINQIYAEQEEEVFSVHFVSFGFKYGIPIDADLVFDVRFLPNPFYIQSMRPLTGMDEEVSEYVFN